MATDLGQGKATPTEKYDAFVTTRLTRAEQRIRRFDLAAALLGFAALTLAFAVGAALLDRFLALSSSTRQTLLYSYLTVSAVYLIVTVVRPLSRRLNPYYAALRIETTLPGAKNSVVNWLDLHGADLPPAIRTAVGQRAAKDLGRADLEKALGGRRAYWAGGLAGLCTVLFLIALFAVGPVLFFSLLGRVFAPFNGPGGAPPPTATRLIIVRPAEGDAVVPDLQPVAIAVRVDGRTPDPKGPDALKLLFRYQKDAEYTQRLLDREDGGRWGVTLPPVDVQDGFWYKVTGGDAETPEYRVRLTPKVADFKATYRYRPYVARIAETRLGRKIEALRGTEVDVTVHANRELKDARLEFIDKSGRVTITRGDLAPNDPQGFTAHLTLEESSQYRIAFTSVEGENFVEPQTSQLVAVPDLPPTVELTKPGKDLTLAADALLELEGTAIDDVGLAGVRLEMRVEGGVTLPAQEYRTAKDYQLPAGGNPTKVEYKDFVDLAKVHPPADDLFKLRPGMVLEYWLTARDACDFHQPNVGESKHFKVKIVEPIENPKAGKQARDKAEQDKKEAEDRQKQEQEKENKRREEQKKKTEEQNQENANGGTKDDQEGKTKVDPKGGDSKDKSGTPKDSGGDANPKPDGGEKKDPKRNPDDKPNTGSGQENKSPQKGDGKGDPKQQPSGEGKEGGQPQKQPKAGEGKEGGGHEGKQEAGKEKSAGQPGDKHEESAGKDEGKPGSSQPKPSEGKSGESKPGPDNQPAQGKDGGKEAAPKPAEGKAGDPKDGQQQEAGKDKPDSGGAASAKTDKAEPKDGGKAGSPADKQPAAEAKDKPAAGNHGEAKDAGKENVPDKDAAKSAAKDGAQSPAGDKKAEAEHKDEGPKSDKNDVARAEPKPDGGARNGPKSDELTPEQKAEAEKALKKLADDLEGNDPAKRAEALQKLRDVAKYIDDAKKREEFEKSLDRYDDKKFEEFLKNRPDPLTEQKPQDQPPGMGEPTPPKKEQPSQGKGADGMKDSGTAKNDPPPAAKDDPAKGQSKSDGQSDKPADPNNPPASPGTPKGGPGIPDGKPRTGDDPPTVENPPKPANPETPKAQKAAVLQLKNFLNTVDKKALQDGTLPPDQMKNLLGLVNLANQDAGTNEKLPDPTHGGPLGSTGGKVVKPTDGGLTDDPNNGGRPLPPPGFRDPYKEFSKLLAEPDAPDKK